MKKIVIDPLTRIEGHLKVEVVVDGGEVKEARCSGTLFRGWEIILKGRHPLDAQRITQRVCGVCPTAHATASSFALDDAFGVADRIPDNGRLLRNLILGCNYIQSHVLHFYHLAALDFVDVTAVADYDGEDDDLQAVKAFIGRGALGPFVPRHEGDYRFSPEVNRTLTAHYVQALRARRLAHEMLCIFGGKMPHSATIMPGGNSEVPTMDKISTFLGKLSEVQNFIDTRYVPDVLAVAKVYSDHAGVGGGCNRYLAYGSFDLKGENVDPATRERLLPQGLVTADGEFQKIDAAQITESVASSWFSSPSKIRPRARRSRTPTRKADTVGSSRRATTASPPRSARSPGRWWRIASARSRSRGSWTRRWASWAPGRTRCTACSAATRPARSRPRSSPMQWPTGCWRSSRASPSAQTGPCRTRPRAWA